MNRNNASKNKKYSKHKFNNGKNSNKSNKSDKKNSEKILLNNNQSELIKYEKPCEENRNKKIENIKENSNLLKEQDQQKAKNQTQSNENDQNQKKNLILKLLSANRKLSSGSTTEQPLCNLEIQKILKEKFSSQIGQEFDPNLMFKNFQKIFNQNLTDNIETSDEDEEFVEYVFKPRQYFLFSLCQFCKNPSKKILISCNICHMTYYCGPEHMSQDRSRHIEFCTILSAIAKRRDGHIFNNCKNFNAENYRSYRVTILNLCEEHLSRQLLPFEKEIILFPRICCNNNCREWRENFLKNCEKCEQIAFCKNNSEHLDIDHKDWCKSFILLRKLIGFQEKYGKIEPNLPSKILDKQLNCPTQMNRILQEIYKNMNDIKDECSYSTLTQIATAPLTAWYCAKISGLLNKTKLTVHLIGAELQFEVDILHKWELFFLHITPGLKELNIVFVGPELENQNVSLEPLTKIKTCKICRNHERNINYFFKNTLYHDYLKESSILTPDLICFFNPGLYRSTGFNTMDTWPETIKVSAKQKCPIIITSYTQYESPLDLKRFLKESQRPVSVLLPPTVNPFHSQRPERNFISDEYAPMIFKNFYCFIIQ